MNRKFGGGKPPTGTPSMAWSTVVVVVSLLAGASVVHNFFKPDLVTSFVKAAKNFWVYDARRVKN
ncbi:hypothetical protein RDI58_010077 [Solanum bulbocastanum]|uniref:Uncharacterized protein n=1 Tax=Solanum bulbocastanum TaxID=147425 RepID=A0AAN8TST2_SOLBU